LAIADWCLMLSIGLIDTMDSASPRAIVNRHAQSSIAIHNQQSTLTIVNRHSQSAIDTHNRQSPFEKSAAANPHSAIDPRSTVTLVCGRQIWCAVF
jgi:hypothetical protein